MWQKVVEHFSRMLNFIVHIDTELALDYSAGLCQLWKQAQLACSPSTKIFKAISNPNPLLGLDELLIGEMCLLSTSCISSNKLENCCIDCCGYFVNVYHDLKFCMLKGGEETKPATDLCLLKEYVLSMTYCLLLLSKPSLS